MGFYVSVDELVLVRRGKRHGYLPADVGGALGIQRSLAPYDLGERFALHELHYYVVDVAFAAYVVDVYDVGIDYARSKLGFAAEAFDEHVVAGEFGP